MSKGPPESAAACDRGAHNVSIFESPHDSSKRSRKQYLARGTADELRRMAAAFDAINDANTDIETARAAVATLEDFRRKNQFELTPSETDFARIAAARCSCWIHGRTDRCRMGGVSARRKVHCDLGNELAST